MAIRKLALVQNSEMPSDRVVFCDRGQMMGRLRNIEKLFAGRHFDREVILLCVRWYLRYKLSFHDLVEMMAERGLQLAHTTILRCQTPAGY